MSLLLHTSLKLTYLQLFHIFQDQIKSIIEAFDKCPNPLKGKHIRTAILATTPYIFANIKREIVLDDEGYPLGVLSGILKTLAKYLVKIFKI